MLDGVPWFVGGGAHHSPEVARLLAYAATGGAEGIIEVGDLKVVPLSVPGGAVEALPGGVLIRNRGAGGDSQTYVARGVTATRVDITPTGSSGGRSDLIVARIEDPNVAGEPWQTPPSVEDGPYVFIRPIPNVPAGTTRLQDVPGYEGQSAVTLARIDLPASTGTVTASMITDLRQVARPRRERRMLVFDPPNDRHLGTSTSWQAWPISANDTGVVGSFAVPEWATHVRVLTTYTGIAMRSGSYGSVRVTLGTLAITGGWDTQGGTGTDPFQAPITVASELAVPAAMRGQSVNVALHGRPATSGQSASTLPWTTGAARVVVDIEVEERAA